MKRELPCECCGKQVQLSKARLRELAEARRQPLCKQCRRYISPVTARMPEVEKVPSLTSLVLRKKVRKNAKRSKALASFPLGRCCVRGEVDE